MFSNEKGATAVPVSELTRHAEKPVSGETQNESFGVKICQANKTILVARVVRKKKMRLACTTASWILRWTAKQF